MSRWKAPVKTDVEISVKIYPLITSEKITERFWGIFLQHLSSRTVLVASRWTVIGLKIGWWGHLRWQHIEWELLLRLGAHTSFLVCFLCFFFNFFFFCNRCKLEEKFGSGQRFTASLILPVWFTFMDWVRYNVSSAGSSWQFSNYILEINLHSSCWNNKDMQISIWDLDVYCVFCFSGG